ncbi:MAG: hypothetical protein EHM43_04405 [Ignavibacteriae bacterium]|nr:MAG: hypothetical protein EHM43_04405 [Ignavibacteriota bacterium]
MRKANKILLICGSMNQTTMMVQISRHLSQHDIWFTPHYTDGFLKVMEQNGLLEWTVAGKRIQDQATQYLTEQGLKIDPRGERHDYDLVIMCADLVVPKNIRHKRIVLVQEGMTDPENLAYYLVKYLKLPRYLASTSTFGLSDSYVNMCVASEGYREHFVRKGVRPEKIVVTGIPNFDHCERYRELPFDRRDYVLVATSDSRETFKYENRRKFIQRAIEIADGRSLIFKLHPNEQVDRACLEIEQVAPHAEVYHGCDINPMIAHCDTLVTRFSSCVYIGIALGKTVYSDFPIDHLKSMCPIQNGGTSALRIAEVAMQVMDRTVVRVPAPTLFTIEWGRTA